MTANVLLPHGKTILLHGYTFCVLCGSLTSMLHNYR